MAVFHCQGLSLAIVSTAQDSLRLSMMNSAAGSRTVPLHLPSLFVKRGGIKSCTYNAPLPSVAGRWELDDTLVQGWDLSGLALSFDGQQAMSVPPRTARGEHPEPPDTPDWSDLKWVLDVERFLPKATLKPAYKDLGAEVIATVTATGVALRGGAPVNTSGGQFVWFVRPGVVQAVTDTLDLLTSPGADVTITVSDGTNERGVIVLAADAECWLINEAPSATQRVLRVLRQRLPPAESQQSDMPDHILYFNAFETSDAVTKQVAPQRLYSYSSVVPIFDTAHCMLLMVQE